MKKSILIISAIAALIAASPASAAPIGASSQPEYFHDENGPLPVYPERLAKRGHS